MNKLIILAIFVISLITALDKKNNNSSFRHQMKFFGRYIFFTRSRECEKVKTIFHFNKSDSCSLLRYCSSDSTSDNAIFDKWDASGKWTFIKSSIIILTLNDSSHFKFKIFNDSTIQMLTDDYGNVSKLIMHRQHN